MKYFIKTQHGCSNTFNGHMQPDPFHGSGQGAGDSMSRWGFVSDALIRAYNKTAQSSPIKGPMSNIEIKENIQAYVDDTHGTILQEYSDPKNLTNIITHNLQEWEVLLNAVGGKLEISKCKVSKLSWVMDLKGEMILSHDPNPDTIVITDHESGKNIHITEIRPDQPYKLLGVDLAMDGNTVAQDKALRKKFEKLAIAFAKCNLSPADTIQGYHSIFLPGATYGMSATTLSLQQIQASQKIVTSINTTKDGFQPTHPNTCGICPKTFWRCRTA
jgi:hypothetical protein